MRSIEGTHFWPVGDKHFAQNLHETPSPGNKQYPVNTRKKTKNPAEYLSQPTCVTNKVKS